MGMGSNTGEPPNMFTPEGSGGAGLNFVAGIFDSIMDARTAKKNREAAKAESELAYQRQVEMWNAQNAYNSPEQQMKRFGAAGLNPNLIYGQGSAGNASGMPEYHPAEQEYVNPRYGAGVQSAIPALMAVGTWMQNMRLSEAELRTKNANVERVQQLVDFLSKRNPKELGVLENRLSLYPYQESMARTLSDKAEVTVADLLEDFRNKWGEPLETTANAYQYGPAGGGYKGVERDIQGQEFLRKLAEQKIASMKASWSDMNISDPQALIQLVLSGVMGLAGQQLRFHQRVGTSTVERFRPGKSGGRIYRRVERR